MMPPQLNEYGLVSCYDGDIRYQPRLDQSGARDGCLIYEVYHAPSRRGGTILVNPQAFIDSPGLLDEVIRDFAASEIQA